MTDVIDTAGLFDAIKAGELERVKAMVTANPALITARAHTGESAILTAVYHQQKEIANLLVARGAPLTIFEACAAGELERVERLLDEDGLAIATFSDDGWTPRHRAQRRRADAVRAGAAKKPARGGGVTPPPRRLMTTSSRL